MASVKVKLKGGQINVSGGRLGYIRRREYWKKHRYSCRWCSS
jgi:hypothetical protein